MKLNNKFEQKYDKLMDERAKTNDQWLEERRRVNEVCCPPSHTEHRLLLQEHMARVNALKLQEDQARDRRRKDRCAFSAAVRHLNMCRMQRTSECRGLSAGRGVEQSVVTME